MLLSKRVLAQYEQESMVILQYSKKCYKKKEEIRSSS